MPKIVSANANIKVGERLEWRNKRWTIVSKHHSFCGVLYYHYRVHRKYFKKWVALSNTKCTYYISPGHWNHYKNMLMLDKSFEAQTKVGPNPY